MKITDHEQNAVYIPAELLQEAREAATAERRAADELISDAVRLYLEQRKNTQTLQPNPIQPKRTLLDFFEPLRGLDVEFTRNPSTGRRVDL